MDIEEYNNRKALLEDWLRRHPNPTAGQLIELLQQLGRPPDVYPKELDPSRIRCACNKDVPCERARLLDTGAMTVVEPVCPECRVDFDGQARLVCVRCRAVIGWLEPQVDKHGFRIEANKCYHLGKCAVCKKNLQKADIIEMMLYYDEMGIPYDKGLIT